MLFIYIIHIYQQQWNAIEYNVKNETSASNVGQYPLCAYILMIQAKDAKPQ